MTWNDDDIPWRPHTGDDELSEPTVDVPVPIDVARGRRLLDALHELGVEVWDAGEGRLRISVTMPRSATGGNRDRWMDQVVEALVDANEHPNDVGAYLRDIPTT